MAIIAGDSDEMVPIELTQKLMSNLGNNLVYSKIIRGGHTVFYIGKDQSYFKIDILNLIKKYNPLN